jgi:hypothetical protein
LKPLATLDLVFFAGDDALDLVLLAGAEAGAGFFLFLDPAVETAVPAVVALVEAVAGFLPLTGPEAAFAEARAGPEAGAGPDDVALAGGGLGGAEAAG